MVLTQIVEFGDDKNFQAAASEQGRRFEETVITLLKMSGWSIVELHARVAGVEIDIIAVDPHGTKWWIECKGSWRGRIPGSKRGDTVKKAVGVAAYLKHQRLEEPCKYMLATSHLPEANSVGALILDVALREGWFDHVWCTLPDIETTEVRTA